MFDVTALGEILIDFTPAGISPQGNILFERNPGGAPANLLATVSKLGCKTAFMGMVGDDIFGKFLISTLKDNRIDTSGVRASSSARTTLAFVQLNNNGERSFSFYRNPGADTKLAPDDIDLSIISRSKIFHFGSLSLTDEPARSATFAALEHAKSHGITISYDPNLRQPLWKTLDDAREKIISALHYASILKLSDDELEFITGVNDPEQGSLILAKKYETPMILVTLGSQGSFYRIQNHTGRQSAFSLNTVDTTGAGDVFLGAVLYSMLSRKISDPLKLDKPTMSEIMRFASAVAGLCTTKMGAIPAIPTLKEVNELLQSSCEA